MVIQVKGLKCFVGGGGMIVPALFQSIWLERIEDFCGAENAVEEVWEIM